MTPESESASQAHDFLHTLLMPLIAPTAKVSQPPDPSGIGIKVRDGEIILLASQRNMGAVIGRGGSMVTALRQLLKPFNWGLQVPSIAPPELYTAPITPTPDVREIVLGWLDARYSPEAYRLAGEPESQRWDVFVHPQHYNETDASALDTWAYCAARAQGGFLQVRLQPGGIARLAA